MMGVKEHSEVWTSGNRRGIIPLVSAPHRPAQGWGRDHVLTGSDATSFVSSTPHRTRKVPALFSDEKTDVQWILTHICLTPELAFSLHQGLVSSGTCLPSSNPPIYGLGDKVDRSGKRAVRD